MGRVGRRLLRHATHACLEAMSVFIQIPWFLFFEKTLKSTVKGMRKMLFSATTVCTGAVVGLITKMWTAAMSAMDGTKMVLTNPVFGTMFRDTLLQNTKTPKPQNPLVVKAHLNNYLMGNS